MTKIALEYTDSGRRRTVCSGRGNMISFFPRVGRQRRHAITMLVLTSLGLYFGYHLVSGNNGLVAMMQFRNKLEEAHAHLDEIKMERIKIQHRVKMMSSESLDLDLLDEQVRKVLGRSKPSEIIYFIPEESK